MVPQVEILRWAATLAEAVEEVVKERIDRTLLQIWVGPKVEFRAKVLQDDSARPWSPEHLPE
jgi:hypothetical protein